MSSFLDCFLPEFRPFFFVYFIKYLIFIRGFSTDIAENVSCKFKLNSLFVQTKGFDESFNLGIMGGEVDAHSLRLKKNAFNKFGLPVLIQEGFSFVSFSLFLQLTCSEFPFYHFQDTWAE